MPAPRRRRRWLVLGVTGALLVGTTALTAQRLAPTACGTGEQRVAAAEVPRPFQSPAKLATSGDERTQRLAAALEALTAPFGPVVGAIGYDYDRWLNLAAVGDGLTAWTKRNAVAAFLDGDTLTPRWGLSQSRAPHTWDADSGRFVHVTLPADRSAEVSSWDLQTGHRSWCARLDQRLSRHDPLSTAALAEGDLLVIAGMRGKDLRMTRFDRQGERSWSTTAEGVDEADYVRELADDNVVVGGLPAYALADAARMSATTARTSVTAFSPRGKAIWRYRSPARSAIHLAGLVEAGPVGVETVEGRERLVALSGQGSAAHPGTAEVAWEVPMPDGQHVDVAVRAGVVLVREKTRMTGYDGADGRLLWQQPIATSPQVFPYGFALAAQPMLDEGHLLLAGTNALFVLDVWTGQQTSHPLPADGISTTFWPYQLVVTDRLIGVVTNTGAVVVRREGAPA